MAVLFSAELLRAFIAQAERDGNLCILTLRQARDAFYELICLEKERDAYLCALNLIGKRLSMDEKNRMTLAREALILGKKAWEKK